MLVYGCAADSLDDVIKGAESTLLGYTKKFCKSVVEIFESEYLREPTRDDIERQLEASAARGFPGCIGSLDCMHWAWEMCPTALKGQLSGKEGKPTVVLEVVADQHMWISHFFFGCAGSNNDINIIDRSPLLNNHVIRHGLYDSFTYVAAGKEFHQLYYLVDGIYPPYACFVATIRHPNTQKERLYAKRQESMRKDVERTFGVLRSKFRILKLPSRIWFGKDMLYVMKACVIIHNMIIEDEWGVPGLEDLTQRNGDMASTTSCFDEASSGKQTTLC
ncbi:hypothetical protein PR001_g19035 [Phytophthora rubi]|uniref:DDE Tnp4 domain-containing protein n=1 Tax=Phytophthora rubi TaxID=129364 RepID=A0A6A3JX94_9STRA|nr:hypothetical protein PR001_g19035 [Phytophthora rubi]